MDETTPRIKEDYKRMKMTTSFRRRRTRWIGAAGLTIGLMLGPVAVPDAAASTYNVFQCGHAAGFPGAPDLNRELAGTSPTYEFKDRCSTSDSYLQIYPSGTNRHLGLGQAVVRAPAGLSFLGSVWSYYFHEAQDYDFEAVYKRPGRGETVLAGTDGVWNAAFVTDRHEYFGVRMACANGGGLCPPGSLSTFARINGIRVTVEDRSAPSSPSLSGSAFAAGWRRGANGFTVNASDVGAGVDRVTYEINGGSSTLLRDFCSPPSDGTWIHRLRPCQSSVSRSGSFDFGDGPWREGPNNTVRVCASEYGDDPARGCRTKTINIDNVSPTRPDGLEVKQGSDWRKVNDFDLNWSNPAQAHAPIAGAYVRTTGPGGYDSGWDYHAGSKRERFDDLAVPAPGEYKVEVALRDEAGNVDFANKATTTVRFDDVPPEEAEPEAANGWISGAELRDGVRQAWREPRTPHPVSGVKGYALIVDQSTATDPCDAEGNGGSAIECSSAEVNFPGVDNRSTVLEIEDLSDGRNYVHVVPVSGSGVKAERIEHTELKVDTVAPSVELRGAGKEWRRDAVRAVASAGDAGSGMTDTEEYPDDAPPATYLRINGEESSETGDSVDARITADGVHSVEFWARDLAGNTSESRRAEVRIDRTGPTAHLDPRDPNDPELISGRVSDALSGLASAELHYREGNGNWVKLHSQRLGDRITARMDSRSMKDGVDYLFRVSATDKAGNEVTSTTLANGAKAVQTGPLRDSTRIRSLTVNGKANSQKVPYGTRPEVTGKLVDEQGDPVGGASVVVTEHYDPGSKFDKVRTEAKTDGRGIFALTLRKGPTRNVTAEFAGDRKLLGSRAGGPRVNVRGRIKLSVTRKRVRPGKATRFKGRIGRRGAKIPKAGKLVEVQVKMGNRWRTVDRATRANRRGKFKLRYRFGRFYTTPTKFVFRARVLREAGYPYRPAKSRRRSVTIIPRGYRR